LQFAEMSEEQLDEHAAHAAEYLWCTCRQDVTSPKLVLMDLQRVLHSDTDAEVAFSLFELDGDGFVVRPVHPVLNWGTRGYESN
jgi:hypothetical protein